MNAAQARHVSDQAFAVARDAMAVIPEQERNSMFALVMTVITEPPLLRFASDELLNAVAIFAALGLGEHYAQRRNGEAEQ